MTITDFMLNTRAARVMEISSYVTVSGVLLVVFGITGILLFYTLQKYWYTNNMFLFDFSNDNNLAGIKNPI